MNTQTIAMQESPDNLKWLAELVSTYWGYVVGLIGALGTVLAVFRKHVLGTARGLFNWLKMAVNAPLAVAEMQTQLRMKDGQGFVTWAENIDHSLIGLRRSLSMETFLRRETMQNLPEAIFEADKEGKFLWANNAFLHKASVKLDNLVGGNWRNIVIMPEREKFYDAWQDSVADHTNFRGKFRLNIDGPERWVVLDATCNKDERGQVLGFLGYMRETGDPRIHSTAS